MNDMLIAYYLHLDASRMDDNTWCKAVAYLEYIRKKEAVR